MTTRARPGQKGGKMKPTPGGSLVAVIADTDTITGFLLAGVGQVEKGKKNFLVVDNKTTQAQIAEAFKELTSREDIAVILISQVVANDIRHLLDEYDQLVPTVLEIPSRGVPYDPDKDFIMVRIKKMLGQE
eukprot:TRINITY_DN908_c0_g1_i1.p1 TRINITY_DN908_c0_g1~~TRINITY_DN908_c0_g1_i1.p1  ORF type:complete len:131 (+),score=25.76 TRINITY_DN908_c0_g1_i1:84-476(+)